MSTVEDKSSNSDEENEPINQDTGNQNTETELIDNIQSLGTNENSEILGAISENVRQEAENITPKDSNKESSDTITNIFNENVVKSDETELELKEKSVNAFSGLGSGDCAAKTHVSNDDTKKADDINRNIDINQAKSSKSDVMNQKPENSNSSFDKSDKMEQEIGDETANTPDEVVDDDDMKLRWDDDDGDDQDMAGKEKSSTGNDDDILTEEQMLEESDMNAKIPDLNLDRAVSNENIEDAKIKDKNLDSQNNTELSNSKLKTVEESDNNVLERKLLTDTGDLKVDSEIRVDKSNSNIIDNKNSETIKQNTEPSEINPDSMILTKNSNDNDKGIIREDRLLEEPESNAGISEINTEVKLMDTKEDINKELLMESENISKTNITKAVIADKMDNIMLEDELLKETEPNVKTTNVVPKADVSVDRDIEKNDDVLLNVNLLEEPVPIAETEKIVSEKDVSMDDVDNQNEEELLRDDSCTAMDVDITDQSIEKTKMEEENIDQPLSDENNKTENSSTPLEINTPTHNAQNEANEDIIPKNLPSNNVTLETNIEGKLEPEKVLFEDKSKTDKHISTNTDKNEQTPSVESLDDSVHQIKTDHGVRNPDVMLEIPTQELIDIDETDISINQDKIEIDTPSNVDKIDDNIDKVNEETVSQKGVVAENVVDQTDGIVNSEKGTENDRVVEKAVRPDTIEESLEKMFADDDVAPVKEALECRPSTSQEPDAQPSTSFSTMTPDTSDEMPEVSDSLGLLAESSGRVMEDDDEPEDDDDGDDDDDSDQDESSTQISADQSEDSNPPQSETEPAREEKGIETPEAKEHEFQFKIFNVESTSLENVQDKEVMEIETEYDNVDLQSEAINDDETKSAVDALLKDAEGSPADVVEETIDGQMEIETVKLSDTSDNEVDDKEVGTTPVGDQVETTEQGKETGEKQQDTPKHSPAKQSPSKQLSTQSPSKQSPSKMKKLEIKTMEDSQVVNFVDLEESSSEDDIQEVKKVTQQEITPTEEKSTSPVSDSVTNVNIPSSIEVMCTASGGTSELVTKEGEVVISGVPKPPPQKPARLNTGEISIKTVTVAETVAISKTMVNEQTQTNLTSKPKLSLEIFSLDSDEEESTAKEKPTTTSPHKMTALELEKARDTSKCINYSCTSGPKEIYRVADASTVAYYDAGRKRRAMVCQTCYSVVAERTKNLMEGIKNFTPLLDLEMGNRSQDLVEISDSDSEEEDLTPDEAKVTIGENGAKFLEDNLAQLINETWLKYEMDSRLKETQIMLDDEIEKLEKDSQEIDKMLNECQIATDKLRCDLYATFEQRRQELPALCIYDLPEKQLIEPEDGLPVDSTPPVVEAAEARQAKRRLSVSTEMPAKRPAIPLGYAPLDADSTSAKEPKSVTPVIDTKLDDDKDISVVKLSAESAPADLPPPGEISRPPLRVGMPVYAMKNAFGPWLKGRILEMQPKNPSMGASFSLCRVKFDHKTNKNNGKILPARCIAYAEPADVRMTIGTRLIALFKDSNKRESYYSGVVAEIPNPVNNYRYLVFFDDGYAQYVQHAYTRLVCESSPLVWEEVHPFSREFVKEYLLAYPERPMVRLHEGQHLKTEWNGKWWSSRVTRVDASLAQVTFVGDGRREWIYRGSTRLAPLYLELRAAERHRPRPMPRSKAQPRSNMPYVEYTRSDEQESKQPQETQSQQQNEEIRRQRAVAKKSTSVPPPAPPPQQHQPGNLDTVTSRVVYYTPKNAVKPYKMTPHRCGPKCKRSDVLTLKELRTYNPLAKPLLSGWERQIIRFKGHKEVMYRAPCGRRLRNMRELHHYLRTIDSELPVDLFDFHHGTHCLAEFVLNKCLVGKKDLSHGKENVPVPCVNYYDDSLPEFCSYNTERTPTAGVPLNLDPEFLCGCDCTDDCQDKSKCACWKMTLEGARTIGLDGPSVGYVYKRLPEPLPSGIYECNSRCKCKHTCLNRVAQHPLQLKLQVFKTLNRGWGIRALNDVPKGSFLCVYAGNLLTDATANLDGLNEGDEYLAELDYIEVVEQMKEGYEEDIPEADKKLDKKELAKDDDDDDEEQESSSSEDEESASKTDKEDDDFRPGYIGLGVMEFNKRLRKRDKSKKGKGNAPADEKDKDTKDTKESKELNAEDDCITISDDEEVREPSRFTVQAGMGANEFVSKYQSVRTLFGKDEACYIMDAKVQGNIGRYLNHSCCPNVFVQNVFVDTHDPRFPWVAFFALSHIKAGTELTWNYNYDVGSVPGKILYCYCGAPNCRGRLL